MRRAPGGGVTSAGARRTQARLLPALRVATEVVRSFYSQRLAWVALLVSSSLLTYGGGAVMFWLHAVIREEPGPAIDKLHHWLLDSTLGFVALTPVVGLILPLAVWRASTLPPGRAKLQLRLYVAGTATAFTLVTGPGPFLHNVIAGAGTPLAVLAARTFGENEAEAMHAMHADPQSSLTGGMLQLGVGLPVYLACTWAALHLVRTVVTLSRQRPRRRAAAAELQTHG